MSTPQTERGVNMNKSSLVKSILTMICSAWLMNLGQNWILPLRGLKFSAISRWCFLLLNFCFLYHHHHAQGIQFSHNRHMHTHTHTQTHQQAQRKKKTRKGNAQLIHVSYTKTRQLLSCIHYKMNGPEICGLLVLSDLWMNFIIIESTIDLWMNFITIESITM